MGSRIRPWSLVRTSREMVASSRSRTHKRESIVQKASDSPGAFHLCAVVMMNSDAFQTFVACSSVMDGGGAPEGNPNETRGPLASTGSSCQEGFGKM